MRQSKDLNPGILALVSTLNHGSELTGPTVALPSADTVTRATLGCHQHDANFSRFPVSAAWPACHPSLEGGWVPGFSGCGSSRGSINVC